MLTDYYKLIEVARDATATEIRDKGKFKLDSIDRAQAEGSLPATILNATRRTISDALDVLIDSDSRAAYDLELETTEVENIIDPDKPQFFNFDAIRRKNLKPWREECGHEGSANLELYQNLMSRTTKLPHPVQERVLLAALLTPSTLSHTLPVVILTGSPATGKSRVGNLAAKIWGTTQQVGATPYAAVRRLIAESSQTIEFGEKKSLNYIFAWDDITPAMLKQTQMYSLFKSGYSRETAVIRISESNSDTKTVPFNCFGMKVLSSIHEFYADPYFVEMTRRSLIVQCKYAELENPLRFEAVNWNGLQRATVSYWESPANYERFLRFQDELKSAKVSKLSSDKIELCTDVLSSGSTWGIWESTKAAILDLEEFYSIQESIISDKRDIVHKVLSAYLDRQIDKYSDSDTIPSVTASDLKSFVTNQIKTGVITRSLRYNELAETMKSLGWRMNITREVWVRE